MAKMIYNQTNIATTEELISYFDLNGRLYYLLLQTINLHQINCVGSLTKLNVRPPKILPSF